jgi:DNA polymerase V
MIQRTIVRVLVLVENPSIVAIPFIDFKIPAGFPSPATDYVETRIDFNDLIIQNPAFTFFAYAEGDSMTPDIQDGNLLVIDRKVDQPNGCVVLASVNNTFCVKQLFRYGDGSIELRPTNDRFKSIYLPSEFEGDFEIFGRVIKVVRDLLK